MMFEAKRLHPVAIVLNALKILKDALIPLVALVFFQGGKSSSWDYYELVLIAIYLVGSVLYGTLAWFKFTYRVEDDEIRIDQGIIIKKKRYIRLERIQSIDVTEGILQRLFSLVKVTIDTAGSSNGKAEAVLTAIPRTEAVQFQKLLKEIKQEKTVGSEDSEEELYHETSLKEVEEVEEKVVFQMSFKELFLMGATSGGVGIVFAGAFALLSQYGDQLKIDRVYTEIETMVAVASGILFIILILIGLLVAYIIATIGIVLKYAYFTVKKSGNELIITRGLLERRQLTIPAHKIQAIRVVENVVRQPLGYATVYLETASGSITDHENSKVMLFPLIKKSQLKSFLERVTSDYQVEMPMNHVPKRALRRYFYREWLWSVPVTVGAIYFFETWGLFALLILILGTLLAYMSYREASWNITENQLTLIYRVLSKQTYIVRKPRIQSITSKQSVFQRSKQLGTIIAFSKTGLGSSDGTVVDLEEKDVAKIKSWFQGSSTLE